MEKKQAAPWAVKLCLLENGYSYPLFSEHSRRPKKKKITRNIVLRCLMGPKHL